MKEAMNYLAGPAALLACWLVSLAMDWKTPTPAGWLWLAAIFGVSGLLRFFSSRRTRPET